MIADQMGLGKVGLTYQTHGVAIKTYIGCCYYIISFIPYNTIVVSF